jgi:SNF2 family DNA or RNA helicase
LVGKKLQITGKDGKIVCDNPCWLLLEHHLYRVYPDLEGVKLRPFLQKPNIEIPPEKEKRFYEGFVRPLINHYPVKLEGVPVETGEAQLKPVLSLEKDIQSKPMIAVRYRSNGRSFRHGELPSTWVEFEEKEEEFAFTRHYVAPVLERKVHRALTGKGLRPAENGIFFLANPQATMQDYLNWVGTHRHWLESKQFELTQDLDTEKRFFTGKPQLDFTYESNGDWFELLGRIRFGPYDYSLLDLKDHILSGKREIKLPNGEVGLLPEEWFQRWELFFQMAESNGHNLQLSKRHYSLLQELMQEQRAQPEQEAEVASLQAVEQPETLEYQIATGLRAELRPYQRTGFKWINALYKEGFGGCLADDMGLGKTLQTLAFLHTLWAKAHPEADALRAGAKANGRRKRKSEPLQKRTPHLIVMPTSLIYNWHAEVEKFCPHLKVLLFQGTQRRELLKQFEYFDLVLTTYGTLRNDIDQLEKQRFECIVLDESQAIKNPDSKVSQAARRLDGRLRLVLTGTPIENSLSDLWSQMAFANPGLLGQLAHFKQYFSVPIEKHNDDDRRQRLKKLIRPFILRRTKQEVASDLPELSTQVYYSEMSESQRRAYHSLKSHYRNRILENIKERGIVRSQMFILKGLTELRLAANHPVMVNGDYDGDSGKMEDVWRNLEDTLAGGHKVLVFSQFVRHLELMRQRLDEQGIAYSYLAGHTTQRRKQIADFTRPDGNPVFLISLKAGGVGLNLAAAEYVFMLDPWWNPAVEEQAISRAHRIGQKNQVMAYKFISRDTIEEKILKLQEKKKALFDEFVTQSPVAKLSEHEIRDLLE